MKTLSQAAVLAALTFTGFSPAMAQDRLSQLPLLTEVAPKAVRISPHVPNMGEHWAEKQNLPLGPIYCVIRGRVTCVEYMFDSKDLAQGKDWASLLPGIKTPPISHIAMEFKPKGIEPRPVPLYQLHIYFADKETLASR
jgi:hypothetical protein